MSEISSVQKSRTLTSISTTTRSRSASVGGMPAICQKKSFVNIWSRCFWPWDAKTLPRNSGLPYPMTDTSFLQSQSDLILPRMTSRVKVWSSIQQPTMKIYSRSLTLRSSRVETTKNMPPTLSSISMPRESGFWEKIQTLTWTEQVNRSDSSR